MTRALLPTALLLALTACAATPTAKQPSAAPRATLPPQGLERVLGKDARALVALFGEADLDVREDRARKLQFTGPVCVLDAYLYARPGGGEAVVTWIDARTPAGDDFDRASCIAALSRRVQAR